MLTTWFDPENRGTKTAATRQKRVDLGVMAIEVAASERSRLSPLQLFHRHCGFLEFFFAFRTFLPQILL